MKYLVIAKQRGEGCDYSIGCGISVDDVEADSADAAAVQWLAENGDAPGNAPNPNDRIRDDPMLFDLAWLRVVPAGEPLMFDLEPLRQQRRDEAKAMAEAKKAAADRAEYDRLRAKYEGEK